MTSFIDKEIDRSLSLSAEMFEQGEEAYAEMHHDEYSNYIDSTSVSHDEFLHAIRTVIRHRLVKSKAGAKRRITRKCVKKANALFDITNYLHDELLQVSKTSAVSRNPIVAMCEQIVIPPKLKQHRFSLTNAKDSATLRFVTFNYVDNMQVDMGWKTWGVVIEHHSHEPIVIALPHPVNAFYQELYESIDEAVESVQVTMLCGDVKNYRIALFDEEKSLY